MRDGTVCYVHRLNGERCEKPRIVRPKERRETDSELSARLGPWARRWFVGADTAPLAASLRVSAWTLAALRVGYDGECWTIPEINHLGQVIGINRRYPDGRKLCVVGSRRGLTYMDDWSDAAGPVLIVEGASDVAAGLSLGLCVVGRPSNLGGVDYLERLLEKHSRRRMVIIAERDEKDREAIKNHDPLCRCCGRCYPGKHGAIESSKRLSLKLNRIIEWSFVPDGAKDLRSWINGKIDVENRDAMLRLGSSLGRRINRVIH